MGCSLVERGGGDYVTCLEVALLLTLILFVEADGNYGVLQPPWHLHWVIASLTRYLEPKDFED